MVVFLRFKEGSWDILVKKLMMISKQYELHFPKHLRKVIIWLFIQGCLFSNRGAIFNKGPVINIYNLRKT